MRSSILNFRRSSMSSADRRKSYQNKAGDTFMDDDGFSRAPDSSYYSLQEEVPESPSTTAAAKDSDPLLALLEQGTESPETKAPEKQSLSIEAPVTELSGGTEPAGTPDSDPLLAMLAASNDVMEIQPLAINSTKSTNEFATKANSPKNHKSRVSVKDLAGIFGSQHKSSSNKSPSKKRRGKGRATILKLSQKFQGKYSSKRASIANGPL